MTGGIERELELLQSMNVTWKGRSCSAEQFSREWKFGAWPLTASCKLSVVLPTRRLFSKKQHSNDSLNVEVCWYALPLSCVFASQCLFSFVSLCIFVFTYVYTLPYSCVGRGKLPFPFWCFSDAWKCFSVQQFALQLRQFPVPVSWDRHVAYHVYTHATIMFLSINIEFNRCPCYCFRFFVFYS